MDDKQIIAAMVKGKHTLATVYGPLADTDARTWLILEGVVDAKTWPSIRVRTAVKQLILRDAGLYTGAVDGLSGPKTRLAEDRYKSPASATTLALLVGASAAALIGATLSRWEGDRLVPYKDVVGIWTDCRGNTANVDPKHVRTPAECQVINDGAAVDHVKPVLACTPSLKTAAPEVIAAVSSLAYNIGANAYCHSTVDRRFDAGDLRGGCQAIMLWQKAGGRVIRGLTLRRTYERDLCLKGVK